MTEFIDAYSKTTGAKQVVPASWLDRKDAPFNDLTRTPSQKAREAAKAETTKAGTAGTKEA
jgi:hypothetical protein